MKLLVLSDLCPSGSLSFSDTTLKLFSDSDYVLFNLEGTFITECSSKQSVIMPFSLDELTCLIDCIGSEKIIVALANNHILDSGSDDFNLLVDYLATNNVKYLGTKDKPYIVLRNSLAILNFVTGETVAKYSSRKNLNYLFYNTKVIDQQIAQLESKYENLILYPHWGRDLDRTEFNTYKFSIDYSKWLVLGHHPHVISGIREKFIYSLGNTFIPHPYYYQQYPQTHFGLCVQFNTTTRNYLSYLTTVEFNHKDKYVLSAKVLSSTEDLPDDNSFAPTIFKRIFLSIFSFKGTSLDFVRLVVLQMLRVVFRIILFFKKTGK